MARNNNNKLKAFVRFDGSGRVVSSSLIVQAFKPKVGNWKEIDAKECCNPTTTTTTSTAPSFLTLGWDDIANANTLVGDASSVSDWNTFFDLPTNGTPFTSVIVVGNDVQLYGGSGINLKDFLFANNNNLLSVNDTSNAIITAGTQSIAFCSFITTINLPALTTAGSTSFRDCISITSFDFPSLTAVGFACFAFCSLVTSINLPLCTALGGTVGDDSVFAGTSGNIIAATFNNVLATCNTGSPDGDIQYLVANNTVTVTYV